MKLSLKIACCLFLLKCAGNGDITEQIPLQDSTGLNLNISQVGSAPISTGKITFTLSNGAENSVRTITFPPQESVSFSGLKPGKYSLHALVTDASGNPKLAGNVDVYVTAGVLNLINVPLNWVTGSLNVAITYPDTPGTTSNQTIQCVNTGGDLATFPGGAFITKGQVTFSSAGMKVMENATDVYAGLYTNAELKPHGALRVSYRTVPYLGNSPGSNYAAKGLSITGPDGWSLWIGNLHDAYMSSGYGQFDGWGLRISEPGGITFSESHPHHWTKQQIVNVEINTDGRIYVQRVMLDGTQPNNAVVQVISPKLRAWKTTGAGLEVSLRDYLWWTSNGTDYSVFSSLQVRSCDGGGNQAMNRSNSDLLTGGFQYLVNGMKINGPTLAGITQYKFFTALDSSTSGGQKRTLNTWADIDLFGVLSGVSTLPTFTVTGLQGDQQYYGAMVAVDGFGKEILFPASSVWTGECPVKNADTVWPVNPGLTTPTIDPQKVVYIDYTSPAHDGVKSIYQRTVAPSALVRVYSGLPVGEPKRIATQKSDSYGMFYMDLGARCRPLLDTIYVTSQEYGYAESQPIQLAPAFLGRLKLNVGGFPLH